MFKLFAKEKQIQISSTGIATRHMMFDLTLGDVTVDDIEDIAIAMLRRGECTFLDLVVNNKAAAVALISDQYTQTSCEFTVVFPDGTEWPFTAKIKNFNLFAATLRIKFVGGMTLDEVIDTESSYTVNLGMFGA